MTEPLPCPDCNRLPRWWGSALGNGESLGCPWDNICHDASPGYETPYLPADEAIARWNQFVANRTEELRALAEGEREVGTMTNKGDKI